MKKILLSAFTALFAITILIPSSVFAATAHGWGNATVPVPSYFLRGLASDADGSHLFVSQPGDGISVSTDRGQSWTPQSPSAESDPWYALASDADGSNLVAARLGGRLYTYDANDGFWQERLVNGDANMDWYSAASDADGSNLMAGVYGGRLYTSDDFGLSWDERQPNGDTNDIWQHLVSNNDGSVLIASGGNNFFMSTTSGATWVIQDPTGDLAGGNWSIASDVDGSHVIASLRGGRVYTSTDSGETWGEVQPKGNENGNWVSVASDADGSHLIVGEENGLLYSSDDYGATWVREEPSSSASTWEFLDISDDGLQVFVIEKRGFVYYAFTAPDAQAPLVDEINPMSGEEQVPSDASFEIIFNEDIATTTGNITLHKTSDDSLIETIDIAGPKVSLSGTDTLIIDPTVTLDLSTSYYFLIDAGSIEDLSGNPFAGISDPTTWSFTTDTVPTVSVLTPADNAVDFTRINDNYEIHITFDQSVAAGAGNITLHKTSDNSVVETFDVINPAAVSFDGIDMYLLSSITLDYNTEYYFLVPNGVVEDESGNAFAGISDPTTWSFTTVPALVFDFERVSVSSAGDEADNSSGNEPSGVSADGRYVVFDSDATNLVLDDTNDVRDIFVYDRTNNTIERVSVDFEGNEADDLSYSPDISSDGRYVVFSSSATNLTGDVSDSADIFLYDRTLDTIEQVNEAGAGNQSFGSPSISDDGRYVAFDKLTNAFFTATDVFVYDRTLDTTIDISTAGDGSSYAPVISNDGLFVAFVSDATDLVENDTNDSTDVFVYDMTSMEIERVSVVNGGGEGNADSGLQFSYEVSISGDGRYVSFPSNADNLVAGDINDLADVFVYDREAILNPTERIGDDVESSYNSTISADGKYVSFIRSTDDGGGMATGVFRYDRDTDTLLYITEGSQGASFQYPVVSESGTVIAFSSSADDLVVDDTNEVGDIFVWEEVIDEETPLVEEESSGGGSSRRRPTSDASVDAGVGSGGAQTLLEQLQLQLIELLKQLLAELLKAQ